jgi:hypothetical protein
MSYTVFVAYAWAGEDFSAPYQCKPQFHGQAHFTETSANYDLQGLCGYALSDGSYSSSSTFYAKASYTNGKPNGMARERYSFSTPKGNSEMLLSMDCFGDPWIDAGLCSRDSLRIAWKGAEDAGLMSQFSPNSPTPPPFTASFLRGNPQVLQAYKSQRQAYLAKLQQDRQAKITAQAKQVPGVIQQTVNAPYMATILSPAEGQKFTKGGPILLMVKAPEKDTLGSFVQLEFQSCVYDPARNACNWIQQGGVAQVSVPELLAGTYRLPDRFANQNGSWRLRVQRPGGQASLWRSYGIIPLAAQQGPIKGPVIGR